MDENDGESIYLAKQMQMQFICRLEWLYCFGVFTIIQSFRLDLK